MVLIMGWVNMCGGGYYSSWVSATFTTVLACTTPTNLSSSSVTPSSATISWDAVTGAQYYVYGDKNCWCYRMGL